jgi:hypothetical protein
MPRFVRWDESHDFKVWSLWAMHLWGFLSFSSMNFLVSKDDNLFY